MGSSERDMPRERVVGSVGVDLDWKPGGIGLPLLCGGMFNVLCVYVSVRS